MTNPDSPLEQLYRCLRARHGERIRHFLLPPPSFTTMQCEVVAFDETAGNLSIRCPLLEEHHNPYRSMQGGFLAAAVDNAFGPLSMAVAPPNVTRRIEMTYSRPATLEMGYIIVHAHLLRQEGDVLALSAEVVDPQGRRIARAKASHFILREDKV